MHCSEKIKCFVWLLIHGRLLTNLNHFRRHMSDTSLCPHCCLEDESLLHMLRDCSCLDGLWQQRNMPPSFFTEDDVFRWLKVHALHQLGTEFLSLIWYIWKARNVAVF